MTSLLGMTSRKEHQSSKSDLFRIICLLIALFGSTTGATKATYACDTWGNVRIRILCAIAVTTMTSSWRWLFSGMAEKFRSAEEE